MFNGAETYYDGQPYEQATLFFEDHEKALMEGVRVLWAERESYFQLMVMREAEGEWAFNAEKQNEPINPKDSFFTPHGFTYWDDRFESAEHLVSYFKANHLKYKVFAACDPSLGKQNQRHDYSAIIVVYHLPKTGHYYIIDADIRKRKPDAIIEDLVSYAKIRNIDAVGIENVQFQEYFKDQLQKRFDQESGCSVHVDGISSKNDKIGRIQAMQPMIASGKLLFSRKHKLLLQQFREFPKGAHDDGPDAVEMVLQVEDDYGVIVGTF